MAGCRELVDLLSWRKPGEVRNARPVGDDLLVAHANDRVGQGRASDRREVHSRPPVGASGASGSTG